MNPNVEKIRSEGVRIIQGRIPGGVRNALYKAVSNGDLGHLKKEKLKPEVFFHPEYKEKAIKCRDEEYIQALLAINKCTC